MINPRDFIKRAIKKRKAKEKSVRDKAFGKPKQYTPVDLKTGHYSGGKNDPAMKGMQKKYGKLPMGQALIKMIQKRKKDRTLAYNKANPM